MKPAPKKVGGEGRPLKLNREMLQERGRGQQIVEGRKGGELAVWRKVKRVGLGTSFSSFHVLVLCFPLARPVAFLSFFLPSSISVSAETALQPGYGYRKRRSASSVCELLSCRIRRAKSKVLSGGFSHFQKVFSSFRTRYSIGKGFSTGVSFRC